MNMYNMSRTFLRKANNQVAIFPFLIAFLLRTVKDAVHYLHRCYWYLIRNHVRRTKGTHIYVHMKKLYMYLCDLGATT